MPQQNDILSNLDQLERLISSSNNQADKTLSYLHGGTDSTLKDSKQPEGILPRLQAAVANADALYTKLVQVNLAIEADQDSTPTSRG